MTPKPQHLADLDPQRTAEDLVWALYYRARRDARWLGLSLGVNPSSAGMDDKAALRSTFDRSKVLKVARTCADWATAGKGKLEEVVAALRDLRAILEGVAPGAASGREPDLTPAAAMLVAAATARIALAEGRTLEATEVAVLASVDERTIRATVKAGTLQPVGDGRPMRFAADGVRQYLYERGVPGFKAVQPPRGPATTSQG